MGFFEFSVLGFTGFGLRVLGFRVLGLRGFVFRVLGVELAKNIVLELGAHRTCAIVPRLWVGCNGFKRSYLPYYMLL